MLEVVVQRRWEARDQTGGVWVTVSAVNPARSRLHVEPLAYARSRHAERKMAFRERRIV
jgi:hypothetical protein